MAVANQMTSLMQADPMSSLNSVTGANATASASPNANPYGAGTAQAPATTAGATPSGGIINGAVSGSATMDDPAGLNKAANMGAPAGNATSTAKPADFAGTLSGLYQSELGRNGDAAGMAWWGNQMANGVTPDQVKQAMDSSSEYASLHQPTSTGMLGVSSYAPNMVSNPTQWNVTPNQTVAGQVTSLMDPNSPLIQQAETRGLEMANARGLINSSIGQTAAQDSAYQAAIPIAQADAATYSKAAGYNADEQNQFTQFNANAQNQSKLAALSSQTQQAISSLQAKTQSDLGYLSAQTQTNLAHLSSDNQLALAGIEAQYHTVMQSDASAGNLFSQITQNITNISASKDMDANAKQAAVDNQIQLLKNGMQINGAISNMNLGGLLDFSNMSSVSPTQPAEQSNAGRQNV